MDFQFTSRFDGVTAKCSMEHQAVANWFNTEVRLNSSLISTALSALQQAPKLPYDQEFCFIGAEYGLFINADEVMIKGNNLNTETDQEAGRALDSEPPAEATSEGVPQGPGDR